MDALRGRWIESNRVRVAVRTSRKVHGTAQRGIWDAEVNAALLGLKGTRRPRQLNVSALRHPQLYQGSAAGALHKMFSETGGSLF